MFAKKQIQEDRLKICKVCEHKKFNICMLCGCILPAKVKLPDASCPINKWTQVDSNGENHDTKETTI